MKRIWIGGLTSAIALAAPAFGADLAPAKAPPMLASAPAFSWDGGYAGLHGGWAFGKVHDQDNVMEVGNHNIDGGLFGFQLGYNWVVGNTLFGLETTTAWAGIKGKDNAAFGVPGQQLTTTIDSLSTFTPRLGFINGPWMVYGKGGVAYATVKSKVVDGGALFRETTDYIGWTLGAGVEYALSPSWIFGVEYNYVDLGKQRFGGAYPDFYDFRTDITFSTVLARLSYKFGGGGNPVTAAILGPSNASGLWNGLYAGIQGGYGWGTAQAKQLTHPGGIPAFDTDLSGGLFGGQIGYMSQFGNWVVGTEFSALASGISGNAVPTGGVTSKTELNWLASVTGRLGYAWGPWLAYGKAGSAMGEVKSTFVGSSTFKESNDHVGWTIGGGVEYAFGNWIAGIEYNYYDLGEQKYGGLATNNFNEWSYKSDLTFSSVLARLSYKFGAPAPVVAKY